MLFSCARVILVIMNEGNITVDTVINAMANLAKTGSKYTPVSYDVNSTKCIKLFIPQEVDKHQYLCLH